MTLREKILGSARGWQAFKVVTGGKSEMSTIARDYLDTSSGTKLLDVGCGFGDLVDYTGDAEYVGIDLSPEYIAHANQYHGHKGRFVEANLTDLPSLGLNDFDASIAVGVLHHLTDDECDAMLKALPTVLKPGATFTAVEPVWEPGQQTTARVLAALDRGRYVRDAKNYAALLRPYFAEVTTTIRTDLFWFPYTHCIIRATTAR